MLRVTVLVLALVVVAGCGGGGGGGDSQPVADTTAPTVSVDALPQTVDRTVTLRATAGDNVGVTSVEFRVDGAAVGTASSAPFSFAWNTGAATEGQHAITARAVDAAGNATVSSAVTVAVQNQRQFTAGLAAAQVTSASTSQATGDGTLNVNLASGALGGAITLTGLTATAVRLHDGFAGTDGPVVVELQADPATAGRWIFAAGAVLSAAQVERLLAGGLYFNAPSAQAPSGEIRGQLLPPNMSVIFADLTPLGVIPEAASLAQGRAAATLNSSTRVVHVHANVTGADTADNARLRRGAAGVNGPDLATLTKDAAAPGHWSVENTTLAQADFDALLAAGAYLSVQTPNNPGGEVRGQFVPPGFLVVLSRMSGEQEAPAPRITAARGSAAVTINTSSGATDVHVNVTGADDATLAHLHEAFAGSNGPIIVDLEKDPSLVTHWRSNGATLTSAQIGTLQNGGIYANVHTPAAPAGLVRGQLLASGTELIVSHMTGAQESSPVSTTATARASTTVNTTSKRLTIHVNTLELDDATDAHIHEGARTVAGPINIPLTKDPAAPSHWSAADVELTDAQLQSYRDGGLYVNVHTPDQTAGEVRGQIELGHVVPFQFEAIQQRIFNTTCAVSGCHSGAAAPFGLDLQAATSHANLVGTPSGEVPSLLRVAPGDAAASYMIRKLAGAPGIVGERMPFGQPPLPAETIDRIRAWINAGALPAPAPPAPDTEAPVATLGAVPDPITGTVTLTATATDNLAVTLVRFRANGNEIGSDATAPYSLDWNSTSVANGAVTIDAQALDAAGNTGTSATASSTVANASGPMAFTFTEIQTQIFNARCVVCHSGPAPAGGMSLEASAYSRIVNVASLEAPTLMRIEPNDSANSYMIQKLEGTPGIVGERMPFGGPFLDQATIDRIKAWVDSGAPNN